MFGLVVYTGMDTKMMVGKQYRSTKSTHIERLIQAYFFANVCVIAIFAIISMIVIVAKSKDLAFLLRIEPTISDSIRLFTYIILYSQMIPISIYAVMDLVQLGSAWLIERKIKRSPKEKDDCFTI